MNPPQPTPPAWKMDTITRIDITPHATTPNTPRAIAISKSKKIPAINGVNIIQIIISMLTQMIAAIIDITANIANRMIPSTVRIDARIKNIIHAIPVAMRHIESRTPEIKHIIVSSSAVEIIKKVNPAHPKVNIANASANIVNPNRHKSIAVTIPVPPIQIIESDRVRTAKARNVIVRARQMIHNAKNGMLVHITQRHAVKNHAREHRKHAFTDKHKIRQASTRAIMPKQIIESPSIMQIRHNAGVIMQRAVPA